jgi:hypothetical protein
MRRVAERLGSHAATSRPAPMGIPSRGRQRPPSPRITETAALNRATGRMGASRGLCPRIPVGSSLLRGARVPWGPLETGLARTRHVLAAHGHLELAELICQAPTFERGSLRDNVLSAARAVPLEFVPRAHLQDRRRDDPLRASLEIEL